MKVKNIRKINDNEYVCDYEHTIHRWIPYTALDKSGETIMQDIFDYCKNQSDVSYDVELIRLRSLRTVLSYYDAKVSSLEEKYSQREIHMWTLKRKESEKVLEGNVSVIIKTEAEIKGISNEHLAQKIIQKSDLYNSTIIQIEDCKRKVSEEYSKVKTIEELNILDEKYNKIINLGR